MISILLKSHGPPGFFSAPPEGGGGFHSPDWELLPYKQKGWRTPISSYQPQANWGMQWGRPPLRHASDRRKTKSKTLISVWIAQNWVPQCGTALFAQVSGLWEIWPLYRVQKVDETGNLGRTQFIVRWHWENYLHCLCYYASSPHEHLHCTSGGCHGA